MFDFIRRNPSLSTVFMLLVIASFVIFFTDRSHIGFGGDNTDYGSIGGKAITGRQYLEAKKETMIGYFLRFQDWPRSGSVMERMGWDTERQTMERLYLVQRVKDLGVDIGEEAVAKRVALYFSGNSGNPPATLYKNFLERYLAPQGLTDEDFRRYIRHELGIQQILVSVSTAGRLVTPIMAEYNYKLDNEQMDTKAVVFSASNYVAQVQKNIDPKALMQTYSNLMQNYNLPERVQVAYVEFNQINYLTDAGKELLKRPTVEQQIQETYKQEGADSFKDEKGQVLTPEKAKEKIRDEFRNALARQIARQKAFEFTSSLLEQKPLSAKNFKVVADKNNLKVMETKPFTMLEGPEGLQAGRKFSETAFNLNAQSPFSAEPVEVNGVFYVLSFVNLLPSQTQAFEVVKAKVEKDYVKQRSEELAKEAGKVFAAEIKAGKKFADLAKEKKLTVVDIKPFARSEQTIPELGAIGVSSFQFVRSAASMKAGETSEFIPAGDGGFVIELEKFLPADEEKMKTQIKAYTDELRTRYAGLVAEDWQNADQRNVSFIKPDSRKK